MQQIKTLFSYMKSGWRMILLPRLVTVTDSPRPLLLQAFIAPLFATFSLLPKIIGFQKQQQYDLLNNIVKHPNMYAVYFVLFEDG